MKDEDWKTRRYLNGELFFTCKEGLVVVTRYSSAMEQGGRFPLLGAEDEGYRNVFTDVVVIERTVMQI